MTSVALINKTHSNHFGTGTIEDLKRLGRDYQFLFFFKSSCKKSRALATTVDQFCRVYSWTVWAISVEGGGIPEFPSPIQNPDLIKQLKLKYIPALLAMHYRSHFYVPIAYGPATLEDIESELEILVSHEEWRRI